MVKRYSDLQRTLIKRTGTTNNNLGQIDPRPAVQFANTVKNVADDARNRYSSLAKVRAEQDGLRDGKTHGVTFDENNVPIYNQVETGGIYYQKAFEEAATVEYKESIQDTIAKKIDDGYRDWLETPDSINDMDLLNSKMTSGVEGILEAVPDEFKNFSMSKANDRISSNLNNEYKKLASRKLNTLTNNLVTRLDNLIDEMANTTFDSETRGDIDSRFKETIEKYVKLNFGENDLAQKKLLEFTEASNINAFIADVFHVNEQGEYVNIDKVESIVGVLNGTGTGATIKSKLGKDIEINSKFVLDKFNSDATRNRIRERLQKAVTIQNTVATNSLLMQEKSLNSYTQIDEALEEMIQNNTLTDKSFEELLASHDAKFKTDSEDSGILSHDNSMTKARINHIGFKERIKEKATKHLLEIANAESKVIDKKQEEILINKITDNNTPIEKLLIDVEQQLKVNPKSKNLIATKQLLKDTDKVQVIRTLIPDKDTEIDNVGYLTALKNAISDGSGNDKDTYTIGTKDYTAVDLQNLFAGSDVVKKQIVNQLNNRIAELNAIGKKDRNTNQNLSNIFSGKSNQRYSPASKTDRNDHFNETVLKSYGIDFTNLDAYLNVQDKDKKIQNINNLVGITHQYNKTLNHMPEVIYDYLGRPASNFEEFKTKVEFFTQLKKNNVTQEYFKDVNKYAKLEAASAFPADNTFLETYYTNVKKLFQLDPVSFNGYTNQMFSNIGMDDPEDQTNVAKQNFIKKLLFDEYKEKDNQVEMHTAYEQLKKGLVSIGTIAQYNNQIIGGEQNIEQLLKKTFKARLDTIIPPKDRFIINEVFKTNGNIVNVADINDLYNEDTLSHEGHKIASNIITYAGGNPMYTSATIAIINELKTLPFDLNLADGIEISDIEKMMKDNPQGRMVEKYGAKTINPNEFNYVNTGKIKFNATPITDNLSSKETLIKDVFTIQDKNGNKVSLIPGKTFRLEAVKNSQDITEGYKVILIGSRTTAKDVNATAYVEQSTIKNESGQDLIIPLNIMLHDNNNFLNQANTKELLLERESLDIRTNKQGDIPDLAIGGGDSVKKYKPRFSKFTPLSVGDNTLSTKQVVNINQPELKYINLHRMVLGSHNGILNDDGSITTTKGRIVETTDIVSAYGAVPTKKYHLIPSVIAYTNKQNERVYREIQPGEEELLEDYIVSVGGLNQFPSYSSEKQALAAERKLKKVIADDYRAYKGIDQPDYSYTVDKAKGKDMVREGIDYILNITANNNQTNRRFMYATLGTESEFGINKLTYQEGRVSTGIAQMDKITYDKDTGKEKVGIFDDLKRRHTKELNADSYGKAGTGLPPIVGRTIKKIEDAINRDFPDLLGGGKKFELKNLNYSDLDNPLVSMAMVRIWLSTQGALNSYDTPSEAYWLYKNNYNTNLKLNTQDKFEAFWNE